MANNSFKPFYELAHLNAVVGNWRGTDEHAYVIGFGQAVEVLVSAAVAQTFKNVYTDEEDAIYIDALVYPIGFCARHFVELFLKRQIRAVSSLKSGIPEHIKPTHDILSLWTHLKALLEIDDRLRKVGAPLEEYVRDIAEVDLTGEIFRYKLDNDGNIHLRELSHINLAVLGARVKEMLVLAEEFELLMEVLPLEYAQKTATDGLSREQIRVIAKQLPAFETWKDGTLTPVKDKVMAELGLSGKAFDRAVVLIKGRREFSSLINVEIPLEGLAPDVFERVKATVDKKAPLETLSDDEWVRLEAVLEIGRPFNYSEEYEGLVNVFGSPERTDGLDKSYIQRGVSARNNRFRDGLRKLGQKTLSAEFDAVFPPIPPSPPMSEAEISEIVIESLAKARKAIKKD